MKLTELNPRWIADEGRHGMGIYFDCPCCLGKKYVLRIGLYFSNPIDGGEPKRTKDPWDKIELWERVGEDFDSLTLKPSVDGSEDGHWHGWITNGEVV